MLEELRELYQEVILDHGKNPRNFRDVEDATCHAHGNNPLCGDQLVVYLKIGDGDVIEDVSFVGNGCAISVASASMMTELVKGKTIAQTEHLFERYDTNQAGKITKDEITAARKASITKYDADKDGQLSLDEFQGVFNEIMRHRMVRMFQKLDRDGDAKVSEAEIARRVDRMMAHLDRNDDGEIERGELKRKHKGHDRDHDRDERGRHGDRK